MDDNVLVISGATESSLLWQKSYGCLGKISASNENGVLHLPYKLL